MVTGLPALPGSRAMQSLTAGNLAVSGNPPQNPKAKSDPRRVKTAVGRRMSPNAPTVSETQPMPNPKSIML
jgi:hypothetical protein